MDKKNMLTGVNRGYLFFFLVSTVFGFNILVGIGRYLAVEGASEVAKNNYFGTVIALYLAVMGIRLFFLRKIVPLTTFRATLQLIIVALILVILYYFVPTLHIQIIDSILRIITAVLFGVFSGALFEFLAKINAIPREKEDYNYKICWVSIFLQVLSFVYLSLSKDSLSFFFQIYVSVYIPLFCVYCIVMMLKHLLKVRKLLKEEL